VVFVGTFGRELRSLYGCVHVPLMR